MTIKNLLENPNFTSVSVISDREICGCYCGDLLSWVMGRAKCDNAWLTIMSNINIVAVASLVDISVIVLCENVDLDENIVKTAENKGVNIVKTGLPIFEAAVEISRML